jgi:hypothetical protein
VWHSKVPTRGDHAFSTTSNGEMLHARSLSFLHQLQECLASCEGCSSFQKLLASVVEQQGICADFEAVDQDADEEYEDSEVEDDSYQDLEETSTLHAPHLI